MAQNFQNKKKRTRAFPSERNIMDSVSRQTPRNTVVSFKRRRSEDDAFNDDDDDDDYEEDDRNDFSLFRNPPLTERQKAPSTAFNSMKILQTSNSSSCKRSRKSASNSNSFLQLRAGAMHTNSTLRMQRFERTNNNATTTTTTTTTTTRNIAKQMLLQETPTTSTAISSDKETPGLDLRRHSMSNPPTTGRFR